MMNCMISSRMERRKRSFPLDLCHRVEDDGFHDFNTGFNANWPSVSVTTVTTRIRRGRKTTFGKYIGTIPTAIAIMGHLDITLYLYDRFNFQICLNIFLVTSMVPLLNFNVFSYSSIDLKAL
jgi:hypothetical protein